MRNNAFINNLAKNLVNLLPVGIENLKHDVEKNFQVFLQSCFIRLDLITREEFDIQCQVLQKTRLKLETLEKKVDLLEAQLSTSNNLPSN